MTQGWWQFALGLGVGLALGYVLWQPVEAPEVGTTTSAPTPSPRHAPAPDDDPRPFEPVAELPGQSPEVVVHDIADKMGLPRPEDSLPLPWPDDLPARFRPETMQPRIAEVVEACWGDDVVEVDCSEPPCAVFVDVPDGTEWPSPFECAAWQDTFPGGIGKTGASGLCADGTQRRTAMFSPTVPGMPDVLPEPDPDFPFEGIARMKARAQAVHAETGCDAPATLTVDNRVGYRLQWVPEAP